MQDFEHFYHGYSVKLFRIILMVSQQDDLVRQILPLLQPALLQEKNTKTKLAALQQKLNTNKLMQEKFKREILVLETSKHMPPPPPLTKHALHSTCKNDDMFIKCPHCTFKTLWNENLLEHVRKFHNGQVMRCPHCDFITYKSELLLLHCKQHEVSFDWSDNEKSLENTDNSMESTDDEKTENVSKSSSNDDPDTRINGESLDELNNVNQLGQDDVSHILRDALTSMSESSSQLDSSPSKNSDTSVNQDSSAQNSRMKTTHAECSFCTYKTTNLMRMKRHLRGAHDAKLCKENYSVYATRGSKPSDDGLDCNKTIEEFEFDASNELECEKRVSAKRSNDSDTSTGAIESVNDEVSVKEEIECVPNLEETMEISPDITIGLDDTSGQIPGLTAEQLSCLTSEQFASLSGLSSHDFLAISGIPGLPASLTADYEQSDETIVDEYLQQLEQNPDLKNKFLVCSNCGFFSDSQRVYARHVIKCNTESVTVHQCEHCEYNTKRKDHFRNHMSRHTGDGYIQCPNDGCTYSTCRKDHLKRHIQSCLRKKVVTEDDTLASLSISTDANITASGDN